MKNIIYQYWNGTIRKSARAGVENMKKYAQRIGADYRFDENPKYFKNLNASASKYYDCFRPIYDEAFHEYDNVMFADTDVFAVQDLKENVFDALTGEIAMCTEPFQPKQRQITLGRITTQKDELWARVVKDKFGGTLPRDEDNLLKVYNSGVVLYSNTGLLKAKEEFVPFNDYIKEMQHIDVFYTLDQPYLHAMVYSTSIDFQELDNGWNSYIHGTKDKFQPKRRIMDWRNENTKFVHCQFPGADDMSEEQLLKVVNLPRDQWDYDI